MSDQKKWFKVWSSILIDPTHSNMKLEDVGRWTRLGAMAVSVGDNGILKIIPPAKAFLTAMDAPNIETAKLAVLKLPNVQIEEGKSVHGDFTVTIKNWFKYQVDSTYLERKKRSRCKRRGEERREEEKRGDIPLTPKNRFIPPTPQEATDYAKGIGFILDGEKFVSHYETSGWKRGNTPIKSWKACIKTWKANNSNFSNGQQSPPRMDLRQVWVIERETGRVAQTFKDLPASEANAKMQNLLDEIDTDKFKVEVR